MSEEKNKALWIYIKISAKNKADIVVKNSLFLSLDMKSTARNGIAISSVFVRKNNKSIIQLIL